MLKHTEDYSLLIDNYIVRHFLTPGITGWAQVNGYRGETKETSLMNERVKADIWYLENWSFFLDLKIVFLTVWQAIRGNEKCILNTCCCTLNTYYPYPCNY
jgi:lipopolysaccharide/colanic/teichoic acid biosynthesis glycosyltransferase